MRSHRHEAGESVQLLRLASRGRARCDITEVSQDITLHGDGVFMLSGKHVNKASLFNPEML